jgi:DNA-binding CsgD family transcriptional regulator
MRPTAVLFIIDPDRNPVPSEKLLQTLYHLTPAEIRVCTHLLEGKSLVDAAELVGISINTAKTHLKSAFSKTGTARQSQLIKLLAHSLPHEID